MTSTKSTPAIRTNIIRLTIGSFSIAALLGIFALLKGGEFSETQGNVLLTTLLVGVVSIAILCFLTTAGTTAQWVGVAGGIVIPIPLVLSLIMIWGGADSEWLWKTLAVSTTVAASIAHACLLLALGALASSTVRKLLYGTLLAITVVAAMIIAPILSIGSDLGEWYWRIFGVIAILDVLGTVTVAALMKFGTGDRSDHDDRALRIAPAMDARLKDAARRSGRSESDLVNEALDRHLDSFSEAQL